MLKAALKYAEKGWKVLPIRYKQKIPLIHNWVEKATSDKETIQQWFKEKKNIGVATGRRSGFWVLDIDGEDGLQSLKELESEHGELPETITQITGSGGYHYLFKYDERIIKGSPKIRKGIDIRTDGNQIVVFPSIHPNGKKYEWELNGVKEVVKAPEWLINEILKEKKREAVSVEADIAEGERNTKLYKIACKYLNEGITGKALYALIHSLNEERCYPPLDEPEVDNIVRSAEKFQPTKKLFEESEDINLEEILKRPAERANEYYTQSLNREGLLGYKLEGSFKALEKNLDGVQAGMYLVGAIANVGKTTWLLNLSKALISGNKGLNVLFFSIDDHFKKIYFRLLAMEANIEINKVANIGEKVRKNKDLSSEQKENYLKNFNISKEKTDKLLENLILLDETDGNSLDFIKQVTESAYLKNDNLVVIVDNFHKIRTPGVSTDAKTRFTYLSEEMKALSNKYEIPLLMTVELRKLNHNSAPNPDDLKDTVDLHYDCDVTFMLHSESERKEDSDRYRQLGEKRYPIIDIHIQKNKISDFKGKLEYILMPDKAIYQELWYYDLTEGEVVDDIGLLL